MTGDVKKRCAIDRIELAQLVIEDKLGDILPDVEGNSRDCCRLRMLRGIALATHDRCLSEMIMIGALQHNNTTKLLTTFLTQAKRS